MIPQMQPMLAGTLKKPELLKFPVIVSPKLDGVRAVVIGGQLWSRNMKLIPNAHVQELFANPIFDGLDGELIAGEPTEPDCFRKTSGDIMRRDGTPSVRFYVFDDFEHKGGFHARWKALSRVKSKHVVIVPHKQVENAEELAEFEESCLMAGYEGVMIRSIDGPYKNGRSTEKEGFLLKLKRFEDAEATILGFEERQHNGNEKDDSGKRTTHKAGKTGLGTLGAIKVMGLNGIYKGVLFDIGTGFDDAQRAEIWRNLDVFQGRTVKFKYFPSGSKDKPRFPVFLAFRPEE
jgi:DNA ligase-1